MKNMVGDTVIDPSQPVGEPLPNERELKLLGRVLALLDKGNVRYSDRNFEEEREALCRDIEAFFVDSLKEIIDEGRAQAKPVVRLPVLP